MLTFFLSSQLFSGLLLASIFSLNHNGMKVYSKEEAKAVDFYQRQIVTGRDVTHSVLMTWMAGGLNYQIEHHMFPMIPRHHFHKIQPLVASLCKKHGVPYHMTNFWDGTMEVLQRLSNVGAASRKL